MTDALVEAVARALCKATFPHPQGPMPEGHPAYTFQARAALAAIEASGYAIVPDAPTPEMLHAGQSVLDERRPVSVAYAVMLNRRPRVTE
jgi:hypothetical protein